MKLPELIIGFGWPDKHPDSQEDNFEYKSFC